MKNVTIAALILFNSIGFGKVYDCFPIFNEIELLKVRLHELDEVVDHFVIIEGSKTYAGEDKPLFFQERIDEFEEFRDKITHVIVDDFPAPTGRGEHDNWACQTHTRDCKLRGLIGCKDDDLVIIGDLDEIPTVCAIEQAKRYFSSHNTLESVGLSLPTTINKKIYQRRQINILLYTRMM